MYNWFCSRNHHFIYMTDIQPIWRKTQNQSINRLRNSWFTTSFQVCCFWTCIFDVCCYLTWMVFFMFVVFYHECLLLDGCCFFNTNVCYLLIVVFEHECLLYAYCCLWTWMFVICLLLSVNMNVCYLLIVLFVIYHPS